MKFFNYVWSIILLIQSPLLFADNEQSKNLHGQYERVQVNDLSDFRHRVTGLIYDTNQKTFCTGTLIGPRHILTAAHCVYNFEKKIWSEGFSFSPGKIKEETTPESNEFSGVQFKRFFVLKEYIATKKAEYDFAVVELEKPVGEKIGWSGFRAVLEAELAPKLLEINFAGYPGDKDFGTLWSVTCPATPKGQLLTYYCDSYGGMSGAALYLENDPNNFIIGVHGWGGPDVNGGVVINSLNYYLINQWKNFKKFSANTFIYLKKSNP